METSLFVLFFCRGVFLPRAGWEYPFCVGKGVKVKCQLCHQDAPVLIRLCFYTREGIQVCEDCYQAVNSRRHKPYSKLMDRLAMAEAGYHANRKLARLER